VAGLVSLVASVPTTLVGSFALGFCANATNEGSFTPRRGQCNLLPSTAVTVAGGGLFVSGVAGIAYGSATVPAGDGTPQEATRPRSVPLEVLGVGGIVVGLPTMLLGGIATALAAGPYDTGGNAAPGIAVGTLITAAGGGMVAGGIWAIAHGSAPVPVATRASLVPSVALGPRSGSLTWRF
jgi:hypothetical protein